MIHRSIFFFFNDTATTEIYTLSLHDALPISWLPTLGKEKVSICRIADGTPVNGVKPSMESSFHLGILRQDRKSTRLNSSHANISYAVFCLKKKKDIHVVVNAEQLLSAVDLTG